MSKEEVVAILSDIRSGYNCFDVNEEPKYSALSTAIKALQEQKVGKWIPYPIADGCVQCSVCGVLSMCRSNYCSTCGAKMEGAEE